MFFYPLYNWFYASFLPSRTSFIATLWVTVALLLALLFSWKRWWIFTFAGVALVGINLLAYSGVVAPRSEVANRQNWVDVLLVTVIGTVFVTTVLQWRYGDPPRRRS